MEKQNEFENQELKQQNAILNEHETEKTGNNVFEEAGEEDEDMGQLNEGDNRFMDNEEEIDDPLEQEDFEEIDEDDDA